MMSKAEARKKSNDDLNNGKLLNEIETISKALYLDRKPSKSSSSVSQNRPKSAEKTNIPVPDLKSKHGSHDPSSKDKKSFWNWKALKALSHIKNRRFNCRFTLEVHSIEGLPFEFNGLTLCVHWKRRDGEVMTSPIKVVKGVAKFEEKLTHTCSVLGSRSGAHHSAKYEARHFLLYAVVHRNPKLDLGKQRVDLTRLLPLTLEELEDQKSSGTWTTSFKLSGKAKGALMNVSFGYQVLGDCLAPNDKNVLQVLESNPGARTGVKYNFGNEKGSPNHAESLPANHRSSVISHSVEDEKVLHEVLPARVPDFSASVDMLYQKFDEEKLDNGVDRSCENDLFVDDVGPAKPFSCSPTDSSNANIVNEDQDAEFSVVEKGMEHLEENLISNDGSAELAEPTVSSSKQLDFGYQVLGDCLAPNDKNVLQVWESNPGAKTSAKYDLGNEKGSINHAESSPANRRSSVISHSVEDEKVLHEVVPARVTDFSASVDMLYQKFDEEKLDNGVERSCENDLSVDDVGPAKPFSCSPTDSSNANIVNEDQDAEFSVVEKGTEHLEENLISNDGSVELDEPTVSSSKQLDYHATSSGESITQERSSITGEIGIHDHNSQGKDACTKLLLLEDLESILSRVENPEKVVLETPEADIVDVDQDAEFSVVENGTEHLEENLISNYGSAELDESTVSSSEQLDFHATSSGESITQERSSITDEIGIHDHNSQGEDAYTKLSLLEDLESVLNRVENLEKVVLDTPEANSELSDQENKIEDKSNHSSKSLNLDDIADSVADEFLSMLGIDDSSLSFGPDSEPESPRERLLREFQKEAEASGCSFFGFDIDEADVAEYDDDYAPIISGWEEFSEDCEFFPTGEMEYPDIRAKEMEELATPTMAMEIDERTFLASCGFDFGPVDELQDAKIRAKMLEDFETQVLMEDWGLNEKAFQSSPPYSRSGFGSPIDLSKEPIELPSLAEGLGSTIQTETGGFLRSMNPVLFRNAKSGGSLVMQVSSPVVVPAELGSGVTEILEHLASVGLEKLSMQTKKLMPLEDITGRTIQQMAWERQNLLKDKTESAEIASAGKKRAKGASANRKSKKSSSSYAVDDVDSEYVSLEDLAPLAMDKIEALSIEGLKIQSGMSDEEVSSNISAQSVGEFSALEGKQSCSSVSLGMEGAAGLQLLDVKDGGTDDIDGLMGLSLTLDEWMKLDSGEIDEEEMTERTSKLLAAHHANWKDLDLLRSKGERKQGKASRKRCGLLGNNFTVALMVQLRDPFRDFEPVGTPTLALIQVERVFVPPKPKIYSTVPEARKTGDGEDELEAVAKEETNGMDEKEENPQEQDLSPQYTISEVHVVGLKTEPGKKKLWGSTAQQQSGTRWLLANGMGKGNKNLLGSSKSASKSSLSTSVKPQPGDKLWSISSRSRGTGVKWK